MKNSKYNHIFLVIFAVFILLSASYILFIHKTNYLEIFVVYYKPAPLIKSDIFTPIQGGRAIQNTSSRKGTFTPEEINWLNNNMIGDDTGENISQLNRYFAEITALYWIYKNTTSPFVGMFQYRRFLAINPNTIYPTITYPSMRFHHLGIKHLDGFSKKFLRNLELEKKFILPFFATHDILLSEPIKLNSYEQYKEEHHISDLNKALDIIKQKYPHMYDFAIQELNSENGFYPTNMFVTRRQILNDYANWLFSILHPLYDEIKDEVAMRDTEQKLAFAYLSERLFTIYFRYQQKYHNLRIKELPFALASDFFTPTPQSSYIKIKTPSFEDIFVKQGEDRICGFNNPYRFCGFFKITPPNRLQIKWDNGSTEIFTYKNNIFELEN